MRSSSPDAQEFGGSAIHADMPKVVPCDEIWIEDIDTNEIDVLIAGKLAQLKALENGL